MVVAELGIPYGSETARATRKRGSMGAQGADYFSIFVSNFFKVNIESYTDILPSNYTIHTAAVYSHANCIIRIYAWKGVYGRNWALGNINLAALALRR